MLSCLSRYNKSKTKVMLNHNVTIEPITDDGAYRNSIETTSSRKMIQLSSTMFRKLRHVFSSSILQSLKTKLFHQIKTIMTHVAKTMSNDDKLESNTSSNGKNY